MRRRDYELIANTLASTIARQPNRHDGQVVVGATLDIAEALANQEPNSFNQSTFIITALRQHAHSHQQ